MSSGIGACFRRPGVGAAFPPGARRYGRVAVARGGRGCARVRPRANGQLRRGFPEVTPVGFVDAAPHRAELSPLYNRYLPTTDETGNPPRGLYPLACRARRGAASGPVAEFFFAPTEMARRGSGLWQRYTQAWQTFAPIAARVMRNERVADGDGLVRGWGELLGGRTDPEVAYVVSLQRAPRGSAAEYAAGPGVSRSRTWRTDGTGTGMEYRFPALAGIAERWGRSVFHCPFCHGWEVRDQPRSECSTGTPRRCGGRCCCASGAMT
jgi:hypothetical protein